MLLVIKDLLNLKCDPTGVVIEKWLLDGTILTSTAFGVIDGRWY
jgi:hypothetical protein